jgi:hypothetical protein
MVPSVDGTTNTGNAAEARLNGVSFASVSGVNFGQTIPSSFRIGHFRSEDPSPSGNLDWDHVILTTTGQWAVAPAEVSEAQLAMII